MNQNINVEQSYRLMTILWFSLLSSQLMFLAVVFFAKPEIFKFDFFKSPLGENPLMVIAFAVLGVLTFLLSFILRRKFNSHAVSKQKTALVQAGLIVGCALCEATSLFGVVLAFALNYQYFFLWIALGILGIILQFPKRDDLVAASYNK